MKTETLFLKAVVLIMAIPIIAACIFLIPEIGNFFAELNPSLDFFQYPFMTGLYLTAIAYFCALFQTLKLLSYIDKGKVFSALSVKVLKNIKYCAVSIGGLYVFIMPLIYLMAEIDDAPGMILIGLVIMFGCAVIAVFAAVLQRLLQEVITIKEEADSTI